MAGKVKKNDGIERKAFTTNVDSNLLHRFKVYCVSNNLYQNEVIEDLIRNLLDKKGSEDIGDSDR